MDEQTTVLAPEQAWAALMAHRSAYYAPYSAVYCGAEKALRKTAKPKSFWRRASKQKIHVPIAADIATTGSDLLFGEHPKIICVDDMKEGTHITAVVRPEDVQIVAPENGTIRGTVTSVIFKGMHYEITIESGKNEIVAQSVNVAKVGQRVGITVEPDNIHLMVTEDHTNFFKVEINKNKELEYNDNVLDVSLTDIIKGSYFDEDGDLVDSNGIEIDTRKIRVTAAIQPRDIRMTDEQEEGLVQGYISNLIYEGDHYSYVIHTDLEHDFVVDDEYLWNMDDQVGLIMPVDKMKFTVKR